MDTRGLGYSSYGSFFGILGGLWEALLGILCELVGGVPVFAGLGESDIIMLMAHKSREDICVQSPKILNFLYGLRLCNSESPDFHGFPYYPPALHYLPNAPI